MRIYDFAQMEAAFPPVVLEQVPSARKSSKRNSVRKVSAQSSAPLPSASAEDLLASAEPGHWHSPLVRAVAKLVIRGCSDSEIHALTEPCTLPGYTAAQTRHEVQEMIDSARRKGFDIAKPKSRPGKLKLDVPPAYPTESLPVIEAAAVLRRSIEGWFDHADRFALARRELKNRGSSFYGPRFLSGVRSEMLDKGVLPAPPDEVEALTDRHTRRIRAREIKRLKKKLLKKFGLSTLSQGPRLAIQASAGLGKTVEVVRYIMEHPEFWKLNIWIFVPSLDLAEQLAALFGPGPYVRVMRGRLARTTEERQKGEPTTMCRLPKAAELAGNKLGLNVYKTICKRGGDRCQFYNRCPWIAQWDDARPGVRIFCHEYLFLPKLPQLAKPDFVVGDESFVEALVGRTSFLPDRLDEPAEWKDEQTATCLKSIRAAIESDKPLLAAMRESGVTKEKIVAALTVVEGGIDGESGVIPGMGEDEAVKRLSVLEESERIKVARVLRQLALEFDLPRDVCHSVFLRRNMPVLINREIERQNRVVVAHRRILILPGSIPVLLIDADADADIGRLLFGETLAHVHIPVERNAEVIQCLSSTFSRQSLVGFPGASERALAWAKKRLSAVKRFIREKSADLPALAITNLPVRREITGEDEKKVSLAFEYGPAAVSHFGRIRGIDLWKDRQVVIVLGREQPPPVEIETLARGLYCDDPEPLNLTGTYTKVLRGYRLKDGRRLGVEVDVHGDPRVQRVLELKRERESAQAIDRVRLVHAENPKTVFILSNVPLDIDVDRLVSWRDLVNGGCRLDLALSRNGWALPLVPSCLARNWPDLFPSPKAAEHEITRSFQDNSASALEKFGTPKSQLYTYWLLGVSKFRPIPNGSGGHRRWSEALLAADTPYYRARVRQAMGCELVWEHPPTSEIFFRPNPDGGQS